MTFSFLFFTITIKKRKHSEYSQNELEAFIQDEKIEKQLEAIKTRYWHHL
ncbi:hypothetical protein CHH78_02715 [Shouchella clausii]|nr:YrzI family small protein [Shouchella clausii]MBU8595186.1 YrzI family small protein [Shouchella clausii]PAD10692.1 hypothetical protein CHH76_02865 [Shouchella clausii]PAE86110.1 hypothetical protein CHH78_02715 [Shouchella clausii]PAF06554.1 hypothetical protein CHH66_03930 [Shouchella clausii]